MNHSDRRYLNGAAGGPSVSVVLPTFNGSRYVRESIDSCLQQTLRNLELIVVDDGSTDETPEILKTYRDSRLRVIRHQENRRLPAALNTGFAASRGEFLTWTSDDNVFHPTALETMRTHLQQNPHLGLVYAGYRLIDETGRLIRAVPAEPVALLPRKAVVGACFLYRRAVYEVIGDYDESLFRIEDYDYWLRIVQRFAIEPLPLVLYDYRVHPGSLTNSESLSERAQAWDRLQSRFVGPSSGRLRRYLGELYISGAFSDYFERRYATVPGAILKGLRHDMSYLLNRGVISIFVRSLAKWLSSEISARRKKGLARG